MNNRKNQFGSSHYILPNEKVINVINELFKEKDLKGKKIMDAGCRLGEYTVAFHSKGAKVTGVDFNSKCINFCKSFYKDKPIEFIKGDITNLEMMPRRQFDVIFCIGVLPYLRKHDLWKTITGFQRLIKENGKIVLMFQKEKPLLIVFITRLLSLIPLTPYVKIVVPILDQVLYPIFKKLAGKSIPRDYFKYGYLISLQNISFGYPRYLEPYEINFPDSGLINSKFSSIFVIFKDTPLS